MSIDLINLIPEVVCQDVHIIIVPADLPGSFDDPVLRRPPAWVSNHLDCHFVISVQTLQKHVHADVTCSMELKECLGRNDVLAVHSQC